MDATAVLNPFHVWAELARGLRDRFVSELGDKRPLSPYTGEILGALAELGTRCEHLGNSLARMREKDPEAYEALIRALEKS